MIASVAGVLLKGGQRKFRRRVDLEKLEPDLAGGLSRDFYVTLRRDWTDRKDADWWERAVLFRGQERPFGQERRIDAAGKGNRRRRKFQKIQ